MIAQTILQQLGGNRFRAMTGASGFVDGGNTLSFRLPGGGFAKDGINGVRITLTWRDDYDLEFLRIRGSKVETVATVDGIYCDQLQEVFERRTGLRTSL